MTTRDRMEYCREMNLHFFLSVYRPMTDGVIVPTQSDCGTNKLHQSFQLYWWIWSEYNLIDKFELHFDQYVQNVQVCNWFRAIKKTPDYTGYEWNEIKNELIDWISSNWVQVCRHSIFGIWTKRTNVLSMRSFEWRHSITYFIAHNPTAKFRCLKMRHTNDFITITIFGVRLESMYNALCESTHSFEKSQNGLLLNVRGKYLSLPFDYS